MSFHNPWVLSFIPILIIFTFFLKQRKDKAAFRFSSVKVISELGSSLKVFLSSNVIHLRTAALIFMIFALARPQSPVLDSKKRSEGIDIVLTIDVSTSMLSEDFLEDNKRYNRLDAVKKIIPDFINAREDDRIAAVVFGARPYTLCALTLNHSWLLKNLERVKAGMLEDRTAIGSALASSLNRLKRSRAKDKIIILLTDGKNNAGDITPMTTAELAKAMNVKIYTIGAGTYGSVPYPIMDDAGKIVGYRNLRLDIDEGLLRAIAKETGGRFFRATDVKSLEKVYRDIDKLEKTAVEEKGYDEYNEFFAKFLIPGLFILLLEILLSNTLLRKIP